MGFIYIVYPEQLMETKIGFVLLIGFLGFWIGRTVEQFIFFKVKSKMVSVLTIIFCIGIVLHLLPLVLK